MLEPQRPTSLTWPGALVWTTFMAGATAQVPVAELDALTPPGVQAGHSVTLRAQGSYLDELAGAIVSDPDVKVMVEKGEVRLHTEPDLSPRLIDVAFYGRFGVSNPRVFAIGSFAEVGETGAHNKPENAQAIDLDQTINGTADAASIDWYRLTPPSADPIFIEVLAERLDSRMDPTLFITDERGRELARYHDVRGRDVSAAFTPDQPNKALFIGIHDFLYGGGHSYFYRLTLAKKPTATRFSTRIPADLPATQLSSQEVTPYRAGHTVATLPASIGGSCPRDGGHHVDLLLDDAGPVVVEVFSERLGDPSDFRLRVDRVHEEGNLAKVDEDDDTGDPVKNKRFRLGSRDPIVTFKAEAKVRYRVALRNQFWTGGVYRLEFRQPKPEVYLIAAAEKPRELENQLSRWVPLLRRGGTVHWEILALRRDGFNGPITVRGKDLPEGVSAPDLIIGAGRHRGAWTITASAEAPAFAGPISIMGQMEIDGRATERKALGASLLWSIGDSNRERWESRLTSAPFLAVLEQETEPITLTPAQTHYETCLAGKLEIAFTINRLLGQAGKFKTRLYGLPGLAKSPEVSFDPNAKDVKLTLNLANSGNEKVTPGDYFIYARAWEGKVKHRTNPEAADRAEEERKARGEAANQLAAEVKSLEEIKATETEIAEAKKRLEAAKQASDAAATAAEEAKKRAQPRELNHAFLSTPVPIHIDDGPLRFKSLAPMELPQGSAQDYPIILERLYGFAESVELALNPPADGKTFKPAKTKIAKGASDAKLSLKTLSDALPGTYEATLEAKLRFNGHNLTITRPISLAITAPPENPS